MKRQSTKHRARAAEAKPIRQALLVEVGRCELCGHDPRRVRPGNIAWVLDVHEIARGANRQKALDARFALLIVCRPCHDDLPGEREQLAALRRSRPQYHNLAAYNALVGRGPERITEEEVA